MQLLEESLRLRLKGGAIYDALIAATARRAGARLLTRDQRAQKIYELMEVDHEYIGT